MKYWIARDSDGELYLHKAKPHIERAERTSIDYWTNDIGSYGIDEELFPEVTFENSPKKVELKLVEE